MEGARSDRAVRRGLRERGLLADADLAALEAAVAAEDRPRRSPRPRRGRGSRSRTCCKDVYTQVRAMTKITYREACAQRSAEALRAIRASSSWARTSVATAAPSRAATGLLEEFGPERVRDTPLSESTFVGAGIGAALGGMRPIVEVMTVNFSLLALDQIVNNAATLRHMSGGQLSVPLVVRMATGGGRQLAAQHSHSLEGWYAHIPGHHRPGAGARPRTPGGCCWPRLREPDPVFIFEHAYALSDGGRGRRGGGRERDRARGGAPARDGI